MNRSICIHGHFYQPPRENPWLEEVELQDSAYPYHDWNKRITAECYAPNTASRILDSERTIIDIVNNYAKISFNFGPTLLSWIERHEPEVYHAILEADKLSQKYFSGHGSAIAQIYNHMIMPLATTRDKRTQVIWGIRDFEYRFGRKPEGMWLSETAVDLETLMILAEQGIKFTILAQGQAQRVRKIGEKKWKDVHGGKIDPKMAYVCELPNGKSINLFFYDGPIAHDVAFGDLLNNGEVFAKRLMSAFVEDKEPQLIHTAADGETYGHHRRFGDMALAYCLYFIELNQSVNITIYGEYLEKNPPLYEVEIFENSSWSCIHGVKRWKENCGCNTGMHPAWHQQWRAPLRGAMDWLKDNLDEIYENHMINHMKDIWQARDDYIEMIIMKRSPESAEHFFTHHQSRILSQEEKIKVFKLLEMQRHAMLMYTSCGWFFDEISGVESVQVMQYAARAMQLAREMTGIDLEPDYIKIIERAPSNIQEFASGAQVYKTLVKPVVLDLLRVGAHYAISSLFEEHAETTQIYCYTAKSMFHDRVEMGKQKLAVGKASLRSDITSEEAVISFAVIHFGDHNLIGGVRTFETIHEEIKDIFLKGNIPEVISLMEKHFGTHHYSVWHLFKDERRKILSQIVNPTLKEIEISFRQIYEHHYPVIQVMNEMKIPLPNALTITEEFITNTDLRKLLENEEIDLNQLKRIVDNIKRWSIDLDRVTIGYVASKKFNRLMVRFSKSSENIALLESLETTLKILSSLPLQWDLWQAQNIYFSMSRKVRKKMQEKAAERDEMATKWLEHFHNLGNYLKVKIS